MCQAACGSRLQLIEARLSKLFQSLCCTVAEPHAGLTFPCAVAAQGGCAAPGSTYP